MLDKTFSQQAFELLKDAICNGRFLPGEKLKVTHLSKLFQIGPTPIREALSRLCESGLVVSLDNRGFKVSH